MAPGKIISTRITLTFPSSFAGYDPAILLLLRGSSPRCIPLTDDFMQAMAALRARAWAAKTNASGLEPEDFCKGACRCYMERMKQLGAMDFDEMISLAERTMDRSQEARDLARRMHQHLLVDEFQVRRSFTLRIFTTTDTEV
jgi:hypothetical protein